MESIEAFLGTDQRGLSQTLNKFSPPMREKTICVKCSHEFETWLRTQDGLPTTTTCQECKTKERDAEARAEVERLLPKAIEEQRNWWWEQCGHTARFVNKTFKNFDQKLQPKAYKTVKDFDGETSMLLLSPDIYGVGKTHLMAALINQLIEEGEPASIYRNQIHTHSCPVYYITEVQLLARIRKTFGNKEEDTETEADIYEQLENVSLLIIDDVGKVKPRDYSFLQSVYFRVIDSRYCSELPIVMTTNLSLTELEVHIGGASADRLREMAGKNIVKMAGKSYRQKVVAESLKEENNAEG